MTVAVEVWLQKTGTTTLCRCGYWRCGSPTQASAELWPEKKVVRYWAAAWPSHCRHQHGADGGERQAAWMGQLSDLGSVYSSCCHCC